MEEQGKVYTQKGGLGQITEGLGYLVQLGFYVVGANEFFFFCEEH